MAGHLSRGSARRVYKIEQGGASVGGLEPARIGSGCEARTTRTRPTPVSLEEVITRKEPPGCGCATCAAMRTGLWTSLSCCEHAALLEGDQTDY